MWSSMWFRFSLSLRYLPSRCTSTLLSFLSIFGDHGDPWLGDRVPAQGLAVEAYAQSGIVRDGDDPPFVRCDRLFEKLGSQGVRVLVKLKQVRVGQRGDEVEVRRQAHRSREDVRHAGQACGRGQRRDTAARR